MIPFPRVDQWILKWISLCWLLTNRFFNVQINYVSLFLYVFPPSCIFDIRFNSKMFSFSCKLFSVCFCSALSFHFLLIFLFPTSFCFIFNSRFPFDFLFPSFFCHSFFIPFPVIAFPLYLIFIVPFMSVV